MGTLPSKMVKRTIVCRGWDNESSHPGLAMFNAELYGPGVCRECYEMLRGRLSIVGPSIVGALSEVEAGELSFPLPIRPPKSGSGVMPPPPPPPLNRWRTDGGKERH